MLDLNNYFVYDEFSFNNLKRDFIMSIGLTFPHHGLNGAKDYNISENNLNVLVSAKKGDQLATAITKQAFKDLQNAKLGYGHQIKKFIMSTLPIGLGISVVAGGMGYLGWRATSAVVANSPGLPQIVEGIKEIMAGSQQNGTSLLGNVPGLNLVAGGGQLAVKAGELGVSLAQGLYTTSVNTLYTTSVNTIGQPATITLIILGGVDRAAYKFWGISPLNWVIGGTVAIAGAGFISTLNKISDMVSHIYVQKEKMLGKKREQNHKIIFEQYKTTIDDAADGLLKLYEQAKNNPRELIKLKDFADQLRKNFPVVNSHLEKNELSSSEVRQIMDKLGSAVRKVQEMAFDLRTPQSDEDNRYNAELMSIMSKEEFSSKAISKDVNRHIAIAKSNTLGVMHTVGSYAGAGLKALTATVGVEIVGMGGSLINSSIRTGAKQCYLSPSSDSCSLLTKTAALVAIPAIILGAFAGKRVYDKFSKQREISQIRRVENINSASAKEKRIYDGIAGALVQQSSTVQGYEAEEQFRENARNILAKVPSIKSQLAKTGVIENPDSITKNLEDVLARILS